MPRPNVIIITFDCLRPDRLGFAGYRGVDTPTFDRLAGESLVFENAYCQAPNTWISHASMFTGCLPAVHGVRTPLRKIHPQVRTLAEVLKEAGYATFALPAMSLLSREAGFSRGFDEYDLTGLAGRSSGIVEHDYLRNASATLDRCRRIVQEGPRPFFLWVHYFATHEVDLDVLELPEGFRTGYSEYAQYYDGKVSYADQGFLGPFVDFLEERSVLDETLLVLASDHGENLYELEHHDNCRGHNLGLEEEVIRCLLMARLPRKSMAGCRKEFVNLMDIVPTVCEVCGVAAPKTIQGVSLLQTARHSAERIAYFENLCQGFLGLRRGEWKLVLSMPGLSPSQMRLTDKLKWRVDLVAETVRTVVSTSKAPPIRRRRRRAGKGHRAGWWRTGMEPENAAQQLCADGQRQLWRFRDARAEAQPLASRKELGDELLLQLKKLALLCPEAEHRDLEDFEQRRLEDTLSALGYM